MADAAALGALLQVLFGSVYDRLSSLAGYEYRLLGGANQDLEKLKTTSERFQEMLRNDEVKVFKNQATKKWYHSVKCAVNDAVGFLEDFDGVLNAPDSDSGDKQHRVCPSFPDFFDFNRLWNHHKLGERMKSLLHRFDSLDDEKFNLDFEEIDLSLNRETVSTLSENVFGRKDEKEEIIQTLLNPENIQTNGHPFIYAIIGMGGIGKTTLAQLIYNDKKVVKKFDCRIWVFVSQTFDVKQVMEKIIETHSKQTHRFESLETTQSHLIELLKEKKFLLVLDDLWNENEVEWNKLKSSLKFGATGSSILLTTRGSDVAWIAGAHDRHDIAVLSEDQCWRVFKDSSFLDETQKNRELEVIGKQIVGKCGGLPLAAKSLGGSLRWTREVGEWKSVKDSPIWEVEQSGGILPALRLSLNRLKSHARNCFAFCSMYPKGYAMDGEDLILLWMANGLLPLHQTREPEDVGNKILNELVLKSFVSVSDDFEYYIHDLMHDLANSFKNDKFCLEEGPISAEIPSHIQHLSIHYSHSPRKNIFEIFPSPRTCILLQPNRRSYFPYKHIDFTIFKNLDYDCLWALGLKESRMVDLPKSIGKIRNLKYLDLSFCFNLTHLPDSICSLTKLETLNLRQCYRLTHLPDRITQLISLRHLCLGGFNSLTHLPNGMGQLANLRTLELFVVGQENAITELQGLDHLRGSLEIRGLEHVRDARKAEKSILKEKKNLSSLSLIWAELQESSRSEGVLEALQPHPESLKGKLVIQGYGGSVFASWMKLLENLVEIELIDCIKCERLPPLGQLPQLKELVIKGMRSLKCIGIEFYGNSERQKVFPSLEYLCFGDMPNLEEWQDCQQTSPFPGLKDLMLLDCPKLKLLPSPILDAVQHLRIVGCDKVIVKSMSCLASFKLFGSDTNSVTSLSDETLQNLDALKSLKIRDHRDLTSLPEGLLNLVSLKKLQIMRCPVFQSLPVLGSSLAKLIIKDCDSLKSVSQSLEYLSSLKYLNVSECKQLEFSTKDFQNLFSLEILKVNDLPEVTFFPGLQHLSSLQTLKIRDLPKLTSFPDLQHLSCLQTLDICKLPKLTSFPDLQHLSTLQTLSISDYNNLSLLPEGMQNLKALERLTIQGCEQLELSSGAFQHLINLRKIVLYQLSKLTSLPELQHLHYLEELTIWNCMNLKVLPQDVQNLINLRVIYLASLPKLTSLPELQHCHSLEHLSIVHCKNLKELPQGLQNLTSLQVLRIQGCHPDLHSRCNEDNGDYWPFISDIPELYLKEKY